MAAGSPHPLFIPGFGRTLADESANGVNNWLTTEACLQVIGARIVRWCLSEHCRLIEKCCYLTQGLKKSFRGQLGLAHCPRPDDANSASTPNGILGDVTATGITDTVYQSGLDYLGRVSRR